MPAEVLYRKWRPQRFADVSGQEVVKRTLLNALSTGKVSHAYLFSGPRGTGKTTMGRLLTKAINCEQNAPDAKQRSGEPCNECPSCVAFNEGRALDLVELDGASNRGIDDIRELRDKVGYAPMGGRDSHKVYLIDEVHMLTDQAFNALLKTLEEPPPHIVFILATTDAHKVPATILSRCQRQDFKRIPLAATVERLAFIAGEEGITIPREGLELIARAATGSLRDAINLLEQVCDSYGRNASLEAVREGLGLVADERAALLVDKALTGDLSGALAAVGSVRDDGLDLKQFQKEVVGRLRDLLLVQAGAAVEGTWTEEQLADMQASLQDVPRDRMVRLLKLLSEADLRQDPLSPLPLELALAEASIAPTVAAAVPAAREAPQPRPAPPARPQQQQYGSRPQQRAAPPPPPKPAPEKIPDDLRRNNITGATPEDIARLVGSKAKVIPPASDEPEDVPPPPAAPSITAPAVRAGPPADAALESLIEEMYAASRKQNSKTAAFINGSCHAISFQDGVLTLGVHMDYHKGKIEEHRTFFEEIASTLLNSPVSIRCIMAAKPAKPLSSSKLVQHAVQNRGAKIISKE